MPQPISCINIDEPVKSQNPDGFAKSSRYGAQISDTVKLKEPAGLLFLSMLGGLVPFFRVLDTKSLELSMADYSVSASCGIYP